MDVGLQHFSCPLCLWEDSKYLMIYSILATNTKFFIEFILLGVNVSIIAVTHFKRKRRSTAATGC